MDYIYLTEKSTEQTKEEIETGEIVLQDIPDTNRIWIISKDRAEQEQKELFAKVNKV